MIRRCALIAILSLATLIGLFIRPAVAAAQSCDVSLTYNVGSGPACATYGSTVTLTSAFRDESPSNGRYNIEVNIAPGSTLHVVSQSGWTDIDGVGGNVAWNQVDCSPLSHSVYPPSNVLDIPANIQTCLIGINSVTSYTLDITFNAPQPPPPALSHYAACATQNDTGVLPGTWTYAPPVAPDSSGIGLDLNGSVISKNFSLSRFHQYEIDISYQLSTAGPPEPFTFSFGKSFTVDLITSDDATESTIHFPSANYEPSTSVGGSDIYEANIGAHSPPISPHLVINYFCLTDDNAVTGGGTGGSPTASCKDCVYEATGDLIGDLLGVLKWIWCAISQLWDCTAKSLFYGIWKFVGVIITAISFFRQWLGLIFANGTPWFVALLGILWNFIRGLAGNLIQTAFNSLAGIFNALGLTGIINAVLAFLADIPRGISQFLSFIPGIASLISTIWDFITYWVTTIFNLVSGILGAIPVVFASLINGFNQSAAAIPVYAPTCNSSNTLFFGPCLGMYIIDNTVFDGPMYYVFPLVLGFVALNTILWSIERMKEALSGN